MYSHQWGLCQRQVERLRLIFHLSYDFPENKSINHFTDKAKCAVKYKDLDNAVARCIDLLKLIGNNIIYFSKTDLISAFRLLPIKLAQRHLLLLKARHPVTKTIYFFIDKCLPFGSSISCAHFQLFFRCLGSYIRK